MLIFLQYVHNGVANVYNTINQNNPTKLAFNENGVRIRGYLFQLKRTSDTSIEAIYLEEQIVLSMTFHPNAWNGAGILSFKMQIPKILCNDPSITISGHLGSCDGIKENDRIPPSDGETPTIIIQQ